MAVYEPLRPRIAPELNGSEEPESSAFSPLTSSGNTIRELSQIARPIVSNMGSTTDPTLDSISQSEEDLQKTFSLFNKEPSEIRAGKEDPNEPRKLDSQGVNWLEAAPERSPNSRIAAASTGFFNTDYDPEGKVSVNEGFQNNYVMAANVLGRQFSRDELMKDSEGRRLITLMEKQRTGEHRDEGFWSALFSLRDISSDKDDLTEIGSYRKALADIPFLGWMVDGGMTVGETIDMSKTMRKLQNHEGVTNHEAIAYTRYMLQQQMESERNWRYQVGSLVHSSIPFMFEMALSSSLIAGAATVGGLVGGPVGAVIAGAGALLFGGIGRLFTKAGRASIGIGSKITSNSIKNYAKRSFTDGFTREMSNEIFSHSVSASGLSARTLARSASPIGKQRAMFAFAKEAATKARGEAVVSKMTPEEILKYATTSGVSEKALKERSKFETLKYLSEQYGSYMSDKVDTRLARYLMVDGDSVNLFDKGLRNALERQVISGVTKEKGRAAYQRQLRTQLQEFFKDPGRVKEFKQQYVNGVISSMSKTSGGKVLPLPGAEHLGSDIVRDSMSKVFGTVGVNNKVAHSIAENMADYALKSIELQYGGSWFGANAGRRFARWFADGALDGMLRWDMSVLGGVGTLARSGSALGGKMEALKEAMKIAFVEAPVRGAMQLGTQTPLWPVASALSGNSPGDFVIRGQLGIQSQALMTGDTELMDNARAIALGAGLIEYASENAGRGINLAIEGVLGPALKTAAEGFLPEATKDFGSWLSKRIASAYGSGTLMNEANRKMVAQSVYSKIGAKLTEFTKVNPGATIPNISFNDVERMVANRSTKGIASIEAFMKATGLTERKLVQDALRTSLNLSKTRAAVTYFTACYMLNKGITPQSMANLLERVGYDGIIGEMLEERYGGFFQGLFGLNERPSNENFRERWSAAMEGLFPDKKQLLIEALGFAIPSVTHVSMNALYSGLGKGFTSELRNAANALTQNMNSIPTLSIGGLSTAEAAEIQKWQEKAIEIQDNAFGTDADNKAAIRGNAGALFGVISDKTYKASKDNVDIKSAKSALELADVLEAKANMILSLAGNDAKELEKVLKRLDAVNIFGEAGTEAIRNMARKNGMIDSKSNLFYSDTGDYGVHMVSGRELLTKLSKGSTATVEEAANDITIQMPSLAKDSSAIAGETGRFSGDTKKARVNGFSDDIVGDFARYMDTLAKAALQYQVKSSVKGSWLGRHLRSGLMRLTGIVNAIQTGDLAMAARNPVQWAMQDAGLPVDLMAQLGSLYRDSIFVGRQRVIDGLARNTAPIYADVEGKTDLSDFDEDMLKQYAEAGADYYQERLQEFARQYLAARNIISISKADITEQALRVAAGRMKNEDIAGVVTYGPNRAKDFHDASFSKDPIVMQEVEKARNEIIGVLVEQTVKGAIAYNTHAGFSVENATQSAFDYKRAMQYGTSAEIIAAIRCLPAFHAMHPVYDLTGGKSLGDEFGGAAGRVGDVDNLITLPDDSRIWKEYQMRDVLTAMGVPYGVRSAAENARAAETWLRRIKLVMSQQTPIAVLKGGQEVNAVFSKIGLLTDVKIYDNNGILVYNVQSPNSIRLVEALASGGYECKMPRIVLMEDSTFASKDATSMAQFLIGDRMAARQYFQKTFGINEERFLPPYLRMVNGEFQYNEERASVVLAKELMKARQGDESAKLATEGTGKVGDSFRWGYEAAARKYLEERQVRKSSTQNRFARTVIGEASYTVQPSCLPIGGTLFVTSNYLSEGDGEALLRTALGQAIYNSIMSSSMNDKKLFDYLMNIYREMDTAFTDAANDIAGNLEKTNPEAALRVRTALESIGNDSDSGRVSPNRLAAMAASMIFFTSDRGVTGYGNGFLFSPELALIADKARTSKWAPLFFSAIDRALGGTGLFALNDSVNEATGLMPYIAAFSPSAKEIVDARASAIFSPTGEKAPVMYPEIKWTIEPNRGGSIVMPTISAANLVSDRGSVAHLERGVFVRAVRENCRAYAEAYKATTGRELSEIELYTLLKQADIKGGETAGETRAAGTEAGGPKPKIRSASKTVNINGVHHTIPDFKQSIPLAADIISDDTAFAIARSLKFLSPRALGVSLTPEQGRVAAREAREPIVNFLLGRGMSIENINRVLLQARNAFGANDKVEVGADTSDDDLRDEVADEVSNSGNAELAQAEHASDAVVTSRDLIGLSDQLRYVFPLEGNNYTAVLFGLADETMRMSQDVLAMVNGDVKQASERWEYLIGRYFNALRWNRSGPAASEVSLSQAWDDNAVTDKLLDYAIEFFHKKNNDSYAFVLSAIRNMDARGKRRTQALRQMSCMDQHDVNELEVVEPDVKTNSSEFRINMKPNRTAGRAPLAAVRASLRRLVLSPTLRTRHPEWSDANQAKELQAVLSGIFSLNLNNDYRETNWKNRWGRVNKGKTFGDALEGKSVAEFDTLIARAVKDQSKLVEQINKIIASRHELTEEEHGTIVKFATEFAARYASVADAIDYLFGEGNEMCRALRNKNLARQIISEIESAISPNSELEWNIARRIAERTVSDFLDTGAHSQGTQIKSTLFNRLVVDPIRASIIFAAKNKGTKGVIDASRGLMAENGIGNANIHQSDLLSAVMDLRFEMLVYHTNVIGNIPRGTTSLSEVDLNRVMLSPKTYGTAMRSSLTRLIERFNISLPRSTGRLTSASQQGSVESKSVTAVTPSPEPVQDRLIDNLFSKIELKNGKTLKEDFLSAGRRYADGTRMITVCAGAKHKNSGEAFDKSQLSMLVYLANRQRFEKNGDTRNIYFELYHGEKPTVLSINIPWYVANAILSGISENAAWATNPYVESVKGQTEIPSSLTKMKPEQRATVYDVLFSVLATHGGFQYITTKRTQVILSNATPVSAYRDYIDFIGNDGEVDRRALAVTNKNGKKVTPGMHICLSLAGIDATQDMGMYFHWGWLVDGQRKLQSNFNAVSHKNHGLSRLRALLVKGQGHAIGLGIYSDEPIWTTGAFRSAQRRGRRKLERLLGLQNGILDLPSDAQRTDNKFMAFRDDAVKLVEEFAKSSSMILSDKETQKCGPLAAGTGFRVENEGDPIHANVNGKDVWVRINGGYWEGKTQESAEFTRLSYRTIPEFKNSAYAIPETVPALLETLSISKLSEEEVYDRKSKTGIKSEWIDATGKKSDGLLGTSGLFHSMGTDKGDKLSFVKGEDGEWECDFFLRDFEAQIMANSDASSKLTHEHPAATNYARDLVANAMRAGRGNGAATATIAGRMMPYLVSVAYPDSIKDSILSKDPEFSVLEKAHPNSETVKLQYAMKRDALLAKLQRSYVSSTHAVLCGSGIKCTFSRKEDGTLGIAYEYSAGVTDYDKDTFSPARVVPKYARAVMGSNRTYSTMRANVSGDDRFRYGWHIDEAKLLDSFASIRTGSVVETFDKERELLNSVYRAQEYGLLIHPDGDYVTDTEIDAMAAIATLARIVMEGRKDSELLKDARRIISETVVDYTGKYIVDNKSADINKISVEDLFIRRDGRLWFDYAAFECGSHRRLTPEGSKLEGRTLFLGGSFFSADRRPSGNFEAAAGLARVQAPVNFDPETGKVGSRALYILDPAMCKTQGADTDGDSATAVGKDGFISDNDIRFFNEMVDGLDSLAKRYLLRKASNEDLVLGLETDAKDFIEKLYSNPKYADYFEKTVDDNQKEAIQLSEKFNKLIGNVLLDAQSMNYRNLPTLTVHPDGSLSDAGEPADSEELSSEVLSIELNGMSGVGPSVMKVLTPAEGGPSFPTSGELADLYSQATGQPVPENLSYDDAFKNAINGLTGKVKPNLLSAYDHAMFSAVAADGNGARGVMVSIQAAFEHLAGFGDTQAKKVAPGLYSDIEKVCVPFIARLDGISNALFDVVKDLFAPRCGWGKNMLNYLAGRLLGRIEQQYADSGTAPVIDADWFFRELVSYAIELHKNPVSVPGLISLYHHWNNYEETDSTTGKRTALGLFRDHWEDPLVQLFLSPKKEGIAWYGGDEPPAIVSFGIGDLSLAGNQFFDAFVERITEISRRQVRLMQNKLDPDVYDPKQFLLDNAVRAAKMLAPNWFTGVEGDQEYVVTAKVFKVFAGITDKDSNYRIGKDLKFAIIGSILFSGDKANVGSKLSIAEETIENSRRLDTLLELEDPMSIENTFRLGGSRVDSMLRKMDSSINRRVVDLDTMPIRVQYALAWMRLREMRSNISRPEILAPRINVDLDWISGYLHDNDNEGLERYYAENNMVPPDVAGKDADRIGLAQLLTRGNYQDTNTIIENIGYMHHLIGAIKMALASRTGGELFDLMNSECGSNIVHVVQRLAEEATREVAGGITVTDGNLPPAVSDLFRMLRVDALTGHIDFVTKLGPEEARIAREGFKALKAYKGLIWDVDSNTSMIMEREFSRVQGYGSVKFPIGQLTGNELADLIRIEVSRSSHFDAVNELDIRANIAQLFGDEVDEMERWGAAAMRVVELRALSRINVTGTEGNKPDMPRGFDLFSSTTFTSAAKAREYIESGAPIWQSGLDYDTIFNLTPFDMIVDALTAGDSNLSIAYDMTEKADARLTAQREQSSPISSPYEQSTNWTADFRLTPRTTIQGVKFIVNIDGTKLKADSLEEAVNLRVDAIADALKADPEFASMEAGDPRFAWEVASRLSGDNSIRTFADEIIVDTLADPTYGDILLSWLSANGASPSDKVDPLTHRMIREALHSAMSAGDTTQPGSKPKISPNVRRPSQSIVLNKMRRSDFLDYVREKDPGMFDKLSTDPVSSIRFALEKAFGVWSDETGVKVETVTKRTKDGKVIPTNLIKVTRKIKDNNGVHNVVTYISFGDTISMKLSSKEYLASMLQAINSSIDDESKRITLADLESMTDDQRVALANSMNLRVFGESTSRKCLTTDCLLAMTGLVRLSDIADFQTLFHEYFHQMFDFYRETGICTDKDLEKLTEKFKRSDGKFDEEAAADAFAMYLLSDETVANEKLLPNGAGDRDRIFAKFKHTAQAFLAGALRYNNHQVPVFMKMMISGDFSKSEMKNIEDTTLDSLHELEEAMLNDEVALSIGDQFESPEASRGLFEARLHVQTKLNELRLGLATFQDVVDASQRVSDELKKPENKILFNGVTNLYDVTKPSDKTRTTNTENSVPPKDHKVGIEIILRDPNVTAMEKASLFLQHALEKLGNGRLDPTYSDIVSKLMDVSSWGPEEITSSQIAAVEATAKRLLTQVCDMLGLDVEEAGIDGTIKLNELGRTLISDERIAELVVRLLQEGSKKFQEKAPATEDSRVRPTAADIAGPLLMSVAPALWGTYANDQAELAHDMFMKAADDCRRRIEALNERAVYAGETDLREIKRLQGQAESLENRAKLVQRVVSALARGEDISKLINAGNGISGSLYDHVLKFLLDSSERYTLANGHTRWHKGSGSVLGFDYDARYLQLAFDVTADAIAVASVVRRWARENGVDLPAIGSDINIPDNPVEPPAEHTMEPDIMPQVILQTPGSWLAADMFRKFAGTNLRDMMTDTNLQTITEESNRLGQNILFLFGANVEVGSSLNRITTKDSRLGLDDLGEMTVNEDNLHTIQSVASVRGRLLGLVNLQAEQVGEKFTVDDVNNVNMALQLVTGIMNGEPVYTGYDVGMVSVKLTKDLIGDAKPDKISDLTGKNRPFHYMAVINRTKGDRIDPTVRPSNLDILLTRLVQGLGLETLGYDKETDSFKPDSLYCKVLEPFIRGATIEVSDPETRKLRTPLDSEYWNIVLKSLRESGFADTSNSGKTCLTIPTDLGKKIWLESDTYRKLIDAGRDANLLDLDRVAMVIASDANRLHRIAVKSSYLRNFDGAALTSVARPGLFFEAGTGFHRLIADSYENAREQFFGKPSSENILRTQFLSLQETLDRDFKVRGKNGYSVGRMPAFARDENGFPAYTSTRKIQFLARLLGLGSRISGENLQTFLDQIASGLFARENGTDPYGFDIRGEMTVTELNRAIFKIITTLLTEESLGRKTPLTMSNEEGGFGYDRQNLIDLAEMNRRLGEKLMSITESDETAKGKICTLSEGQMFRSFGMTGSSRTAPERLMSMAESIVHAERFRGCVAQMLTTVSQDGTPNYVVSPTDNAAEFMPDEFWEAVAKFVLNKLGRTGEYLLPEYDSGKSGVANMQFIAKAIGENVSNAEAKPNPRIKLHLLPPDDLGAQSIFSEIYCHEDSEDSPAANKLVGGEAAGYLKQLFGTLRSPSRLNAWRILDRIMAYSKASSVGLSTFFAIATRFESPVAACGFVSTVGGYTKRSADLLRKIGETKAGKMLGLETDGVYLADFLESLTSNDPAIRDMRMLLDMIGMPLSDSVQNPMDGQLGLIDADIKRISDTIASLAVDSESKSLGKRMRDKMFSSMGKEVRDALRAAFHNPGEYAFSNILAGVKMAVVAQTLRRLRRECEEADRPFDPVRELRRHSAYINAEIGGIQAERYAWLTPGMQRFLRLAMFSYNWTMGAWVAGTGEIVTDLLLGGHSTSPAMRQRAFIRWLRMLGIIKVGVPLVTQILIKGIATMLTEFKIVGDPDDPEDKDPLGIENMPWLCFNNESKIGALSIDITPILKLCGRSETLKDIRLGRGAWPVITSTIGALTLPVSGGIYGFLTGGLKGAGQGLLRNSGAFSLVAGAALGNLAGKAIPAYVDTGRGPNTSGRRKYYMHFGKQNDEYWRWFTDFYGQLTNKMSIPTQKTVEAFFGTTNGSNFGKKFSEQSLIDRFFTTSVDPNESAIANWLTAFIPFSAASVASHPDAGIFGMMAPVQMGMSQTLGQKRIKARLMEFVEKEGAPDIWSSPRHKRELRLLCADIFREAKLNGLDPVELLQSARMQVLSMEYFKLFTSMPKEPGDEFDTKRASKALRALWRLNTKVRGLKKTLEKRYKNANVDLSLSGNKWVRRSMIDFICQSRRNPWGAVDSDLFDSYFESMAPQGVRSVDVQQDRKGGEAFSNFLATDKVPETLFGIPVISSNYPEEDLKFFKKNPKAAGFYDLGNETEPEDPNPPDNDPDGTSGAQKGGSTTGSKIADFVASVNKFSEKLPGYRRKAIDAVNKIPGVSKASAAIGKYIDSEVAQFQRNLAEGTSMLQDLRDHATNPVAKGLYSYGSAVGSATAPFFGGLRQTTATFMSNGGKNYTPETSTEKMFSRDALKELSEGLDRSGGKAIMSTKAYGDLGGVTASPARFEAVAPTGSMTVKDGKLVDKADMNLNYQGGDAPYQKDLDPVTRVVTGAANILGNTLSTLGASSDDPDGGKIKTEIPLSAVKPRTTEGNAKRKVENKRATHQGVGIGNTEAKLWADKNPSLFDHVKAFEKLSTVPYKDAGGLAIGYGAHTDYYGNKVTEKTAKITKEQAVEMLVRDLYNRRERLSKTIPNWKFIPGAAKQALLDVSMGRDDIFSKETSPGLLGDLTAAGSDSAKLLDAVKRHYYSYRTSERPADQAGLENRRIAGGKLFFNEDFSYNDKYWDSKLRRFIKKGTN